jgi:heme-degrading monooxygenase HmoA
MDDATARLTIFRSRLRADAGAPYETLAAEMESAARAMPGFLEFKTFVADDGERVSLVLFASEESHNNWRDDPRHRAAQALGRERFYDEYDIAVCPLERRWRWRRS